MNFQEACRELEKRAGKPLEPVILEGHDVFFLGETLRNAFAPGDTGVRKAELDWESAEAFVQYVKKRVEPEVRVFYMDQFESSVAVAIGQSESKYDILCWAHTTGLNYDLYTEDLINELKKIEEKYGEMEILQASDDCMELGLSKLPDDYSGFIGDLCAFCNDLCGQMFHEEEKLIAYIRENHSVPLWWD